MGLLSCSIYGRMSKLGRRLSSAEAPAETRRERGSVSWPIPELRSIHDGCSAWDWPCHLQGRQSYQGKCVALRRALFLCAVVYPAAMGTLIRYLNACRSDPLPGDGHGPTGRLSSAVGEGTEALPTISPPHHPSRRFATWHHRRGIIRDSRVDRFSHASIAPGAQAGGVSPPRTAFRWMAAVTASTAALMRKAGSGICHGNRAVCQAVYRVHVRFSFGKPNPPVTSVRSSWHRSRTSPRSIGCTRHSRRCIRVSPAPTSETQSPTTVGR